MKKAYINLLFIAIYGFSSNLFAAKEVIHCSHSEICSLASKILDESLVELKSEVVIVGDPHDFVPKSDSIKKLMDAKILLSGPNALNPWMKKINDQRNKSAEKKTLFLSIDSKFRSIYPQASGEALAHFWLYPSIYCSQLSQLYKELEKNNLKLLLKSNPLSLEKCAEQAALLDKEFAEALLKLKYPIILTHDALYAYILKVNPDPFKVLAIKGSGHHEEASPQSIKKLYQMLKNQKVVWLEEKGIHVPENVMNKKRKDDIVIFLDTAKSMNKANDQMVSQTLKDFITKLNEIKP
jgi:ABC-type Zn uptake system ZnuABC Zn-binding protein ZnuA